MRRKGYHGWYVSVPLEERLAEKIAIGDGCWEWRGAHTLGYGSIREGGRGQLVHRIMYERLIGPIPEGTEIDHLCRNRGCVNPGHMEPVTKTVNILRGTCPMAINAAKTHCIRGHEFTPANTYHQPSRPAHCRRCRQCDEDRKAAYNARRRVSAA
jgi:HNH endonuclease